MIELDGYDGKIGQLIITGRGREFPMVIITNDMESTAKRIITLLAKNIRRFEKSATNRLFRNFIECPVEIKTEQDLVNVKFLNSSYNPLFMDWVKDRQDIHLPIFELFEANILR